MQKKIMQKNKTRFDTNIKASTLDVGDRVLVRNVKLRGKHKIADKWESQVYVVVKKSGNLPVYTVKPEDAEKPLRTLHRDLLLPCGCIPVTSNVQPVPVAKPVTPPLPPEDSDIDHSSDDEQIARWYPEPVTEPVRFSTTVTLPSSPEIFAPTSSENLDPQPPETLEHEPLGSPEPALLPELSIHSDPVHDIDEAAQPEPEIDSSLHEPNSDLSSPVDETEQRPTRTRRPPDRFQYQQLGQPILKSMQTIFEGLGKALFLAVTDHDISSSGQPSAHVQGRT
ncbi:zinc finger protein jing homolog [Boleophthalmus pectinirostris]|uniref:zinc finger protein jing homolog n=1 Tax=Boleophthalmus pectinirostris TaxID=150288 RepID=UPI00242D9E27|nr:zinc finger protein jing homolog [Boleophthalmus pectinirostris]